MNWKPQQSKARSTPTSPSHQEMPLDPTTLISRKEAIARFNITSAELVLLIRRRLLVPVRCQSKRGAIFGSDFRFRICDVLDALERNGDGRGQQHDASMG